MFLTNKFFDIFDRIIRNDMYIIQQMEIQSTWAIGHIRSMVTCEVILRGKKHFKPNKMSKPNL